jgi:hypothetical protein
MEPDAAALELTRLAVSVDSALCNQDIPFFIMPYLLRLGCAEVFAIDVDLEGF